MATLWTDELSGKIAQLWKTKSASEIAAILWQEDRVLFTRNAIVGKLHRMNCRMDSKERVHPSTSEKTSGIIARHTPVNVAKILEAKQRRPHIVCIDPDSIVPLNITFDELQDGDCRWPYDAPPESAISHVFCGHPALFEKPYCPGHAVKARQPIPPRKAVVNPIELGKSRGGVFGRVA